MKRLICLFFALCLLLSGCTQLQKPTQKQYTATFLTLFDTVTNITGFAESEEAFQQKAKAIHDELLIYHELFDIYNDYEGINNLKTVNDNAGKEPVKVDEKIIVLLQSCKSYHALTSGKVNIAMGSVLYLWHEARNDSFNDPVNAYLPDSEKLSQAAEHVDISCVIIDEAASTVFITDPQVRLDVGAIAKGWAVQQVSLTAPENMLISVGGNVCATGPKDANGTPWVIGIQDPDNGSGHLHTLEVTGGSVVTSGDYQRNFAVDGEFYHHIIDPVTLFPSEYWRSVTVVCEDSGLADALSTALFLLPQEEGQRLLNESGAMAMWMDRDGTLFYSPGFEEMIRT